MARPQVEVDRYKLQTWRIAANILDKQSWTLDKGWSMSFRVARGATNSSP